VAKSPATPFLYPKDARASFQHSGAGWGLHLGSNGDDANASVSPAIPLFSISCLFVVGLLEFAPDPKWRHLPTSELFVLIFSLLSPR